MIKRLFATVALVSLGCGHDAPPPAKTAAASSSTTPVAAPAPTVVRVEPAVQQPVRLTPIDQPTYDRAKALSRDGHLREAKRLFAKLLVGYPDQLALLNDYNDVVKRMEENESAAKASLEARPLKRLDPPPFEYALLHPARVSGASIPKLTLASKKKNEITDEAKWFASEGLHRPEYFVPPPGDFFFVRGTVTVGSVRAVFSGFGYRDYDIARGFLPDEVPAWLPIAYGTLPLTHAIASSPMTVAIYGDRVLAVFDADKKARGLFDFGAYMHPTRSVKGLVKVGQGTVSSAAGTSAFELSAETESITHELRWALATESSLFVEHTNRRYAKDNKGQNAYISALDIDSGALAWRSAPLVSNGETFALTAGGGGVVCGYGFTAEPDFLYVLDGATGVIKQKVPVPSGPDEIIAKDGRFFVRTYDNDLVFDAK